MTAAQHSITIEQSATFTLDLVWEDSNGVPVNISGYTARMQVRRTYVDNTPQLDFTTENGAIALGNALGTISITGDAADTAAVTIKTGVYDLELVSPDGTVTRLIQGPATISPEVTK